MTVSQRMGARPPADREALQRSKHDAGVAGTPYWYTGIRDLMEVLHVESSCLSQALPIMVHEVAQEGVIERRPVCLMPGRTRHETGIITPLFLAESPSHTRCRACGYLQ